MNIAMTYVVCVVYNDEEKSGVVLGYFLCISQLISRGPKGLFFHLTMTISRVQLIQIYLS